GDAYVKTLLAGMLLDQGERAEADRLLEAAVAAEPDLVHAHVALVGSAVAAGDHAGAIRRLEEAERHVIFDPAGLREALAVYPGALAFLASPAYRDWEATR
ncbi:MAG TPA: hypothetical protein VF170_07590, partial [Planctomycetaceae bacterium]